MPSDWPNQQGSKALRILAVVSGFNWPIREGSTTIAYHFTQALRKLGHSVDLYTPHAYGSPSEVSVNRIPSDPTEAVLEKSLQGLGRKFHVSLTQVAHFREISHQNNYDVCFGIGLGSCPFLAAAKAKTRFWLLGDNPIRNACLFIYLEALRSPGAAIRELNLVGRQALYLQRHPLPFDGITWITDKDQRWGNFYPGTRDGILFPNGVDYESFARFDPPAVGHRIAFWGNLSYYNNIHAVEWFYKNVFSALHQKDPNYRFVIAGSYPDKRICRLAEKPGIHLRENPEDMEECLSDCGIAVFPFQLSTGIKNKVLESAAMGKYTLVSSCIPPDFLPNTSLPFDVCQTPADWTRSLEALIKEPQKITQRSVDLRNWVKEFHDWEKITGRLLEWVCAKIKEKDGPSSATAAGGTPSAA